MCVQNQVRIIIIIALNRSIHIIEGCFHNSIVTVQCTNLFTMQPQFLMFYNYYQGKFWFTSHLFYFKLFAANIWFHLTLFYVKFVHNDFLTILLELKYFTKILSCFSSLSLWKTFWELSNVNLSRLLWEADNCQQF